MLNVALDKNINSYVNLFTEEEIKTYNNIALEMKWEDNWYSSSKMKKVKPKGYKHIHLGGSNIFPRKEYEIEQKWVKQIWDKVNPGLKLLRHYLNGHHAGQPGGIHTDGAKGGLYTVIVYLTPNWQPEDGGSIEFWTSNLTENSDIIKSYWPKAGRVVVFNSTIPHVARSVETNKFRISLVFKGELEDKQLQ